MKKTKEIDWEGHKMRQLQKGKRQSEMTWGGLASYSHEKDMDSVSEYWQFRTPWSSCPEGKNAPLPTRWLRQTILHIRYLLPPAKKKTEHISTWCGIGHGRRSVLGHVFDRHPAAIFKNICAAAQLSLQTDGLGRLRMLI